MQSVRLFVHGRIFPEYCHPRTTPSGVSSALWSEPTGHSNPAPAPPWERVHACGVGIVLAGDTFRAGPALVFASDPKDARHGEFWTRNISECPQRRRRVFVVACAGASGIDPTEILFEREGV